MIYYPISVLMLAGIQDIMLITTPEDQVHFYNVLGDGSQFGMNLTYGIQARPDGLVQAFTIGRNFIGDDRVALILGDNIFYGQGFTPILQKAAGHENGATVFGYHVGDPERFGVVEFDDHGKVTSIEEKPAVPKSNYAVTGLYFYDNKVIDLSREVQPSLRGELEITDLNLIYLDHDELNVELLGRGFAWLDTGTHNALLEAGHFVQTIEERQGMKIACLEEIAFHNGWLSQTDIRKKYESLQKTPYGQYLLQLL